MINISKSGNAIKFVFTDSDHYLYGNGEIEVPVNSLSLIVDESNMVTFRKANSNDIFLSFNPANSNLSDKAGVIDFYKSNMVGSTGGGSGSGVTPSEVQEMIDESISEVYDTIDEKEEVIASALTQLNQDVADIDAKEEVIASALTEVRQNVNALSGDVQTKVATSDFNAYSAATDARIAEDEEVTAAALNNLDTAISGKADTTAVTAVNDALTAHTSDTGIHVTQADKTSWNSKAEPYSAGTGIEISGNVISATGGGGVTVDPTLDTGSTNPVANSAITTAINDLDNNKLSNVQVDAKTPTSDYTQLNLYCQRKNGGYQNLFTYVKTINGESVTTQSTNNIQGFSLVETSAITSSITSASTNSEVAGAKAVYDAIQAGGGGGGATYSAGTNISIDTANTINCTLPITANTNNLKGYLLFGSNLNISGTESNGRYNIAIGKQISNPSVTNGQVAICPADTSSASNSVLTGEYPIGIGHKITSRGNGAVAIGDTANANGDGYVAIGKLVNATGTTKMNLNGQIKVDTNNQVYIKDKDNVNEVCIQDAIAALGGLKFVKCTQAEYDALVQGGTVDSNTLYIITNVVS